MSANYIIESLDKYMVNVLNVIVKSSEIYTVNEATMPITSFRNMIFPDISWYFDPPH